MQTCKTCAHWVPEEAQYGELRGIGICLAVVQFWAATEWGPDDDPTDFGRLLKPEYADKLAFVKDSSDYYAELKTLPDFGCVQHTPTEVPHVTYQRKQP